MWNLKWLIFLAFILHAINGARILVVHSSFSRSHYIAAEMLFRELANRGHNVTVVSKYPQARPVPNLRDIEFKYNDPDYEPLMAEYAKNSGSSWFFIKSMPRILRLQIEYTKEIFTMPEYKDLLKEEFDLFIMEGMFGDPLLGMAAHFKCPTVTVNSFEPQYHFNALVGNPNPMSYVPSIYANFSNPMTLWQRILNFLAHLALPISMLIIEGDYQDMYNQHFPPGKYPSMNEMRRNISLALTNYHFTQGSPRPNVPAMVEVGGLQVKEKADPLPADLKAWIDGATHGVIYLSFGTNIKATDISFEKMNHIRDSLSQLKQRVIWKFDNDSIPYLPTNVKIWKWLPQDDLLTHPNIKLFITHGGLGSVLEAKVRGVPIVGVPFFADQMGNIAGAVKEGWATGLHYEDLTRASFSSAIKETMENPKYREQAKYLSKLFLDRPTSALKTAVFWVEYVLRHHGAKHMQAHSVHMNFIELHSIDVIAILLATIACVFIGFYYLLKCVIRLILKSKYKTKAE